jgi:hypothetical protein
MRLIAIKPNAESQLYRLLQSQFACRRNICRFKAMRHFAPVRRPGFLELRKAEIRQAAAFRSFDPSPHTYILLRGGNLPNFSDRKFCT